MEGVTHTTNFICIGIYIILSFVVEDMGTDRDTIGYWLVSTIEKGPIGHGDRSNVTVKMFSVRDTLHSKTLSCGQRKGLEKQSRHVVRVLVQFYASLEAEWLLDCSDLSAESECSWSKVVSIEGFSLC